MNIANSSTSSVAGAIETDPFQAPFLKQSQKGCPETYGFWWGKDIFIRGRKKVYISFALADLVNSIMKGEPLTQNMIRKRIKKAGLNVRFGELREYWASTMTRHLHSQK